MLMGVFQGNLGDMAVTKHNALKYWERPDVFQTHDNFLREYTSPYFYPGFGVNIKYAAYLNQTLMLPDCMHAARLDCANHTPPAV